MAVLVPHFNLPFRVSGKGFGVVEQDSEEDIANCVETILRCPQGFRDDSPGFGLPEQAFSLQPLDIVAIRTEVTRQEPRSSVAVFERTDDLDQLIARVTVQT